MFESEVARSLAGALIFAVVCGCVYVPLTIKVMNYRRRQKSRVSLPDNWNARKLRAE